MVEVIMFKFGTYAITRHSTDLIIRKVTGVSEYPIIVQYPTTIGFSELKDFSDL